MAQGFDEFVAETRFGWGFETPMQEGVTGVGEREQPPSPVDESRANREEVLEKVSAAVLSDRNREYGDPEDNFADIADMANVVLSPKLHEVLTPADIAIIMSIVKIARYKFSPNQLDHMVDLAGYAVCGYACQKRALVEEQMGRELDHDIFGSPAAYHD